MLKLFNIFVEMEVVVGKLAGFCQGVSIAVNKAKEEIEKGEVYCLGEIVHNRQVIEKLEKQGMITVNSIDEIPNGKKVIFRAHGESKSVYDKAKEKNLEIIDLTCGKVKAIHIKVERETKDSFIIIIGKKKHPEIIGTKGFAGENSFVIETEEDIIDCFKQYKKTNLGKIYVACQTTISTKLFETMKRELEKCFADIDIVFDNTICDATELRQNETREMSKVIHNMIIIGGKNSSNTKELVEIAKENCEKTYAIETVNELNTVFFNTNDKIGIMAGASTPKESINEVKNYLETYKTLEIL